MDQRRFGVLTSDETNEFESKQRQQAAAVSNTVVLPDDLPFFRLPKERNFVKIDIMPFVAATSNGPQALARFNYYIHRNVGPGFQSVVCPQQQKGLPCPICDYTRGLDWKNPEDMEIRKKYRPQQRQLYAVLWVDGPEDVKGKIHIFDTSEYGFGHILDEKINARDLSDPAEANWNRYADLMEGYTLKLNLCEKSIGSGVAYTAVSSIDIKPRTQQYDESWYDKVPDLSQCIVLQDYDAIKAKFEHGTSAPSASVGEKVDKATSDYDPTAGYHPLVTPSTPTAAPVSLNTQTVIPASTVMAEDSDPF